MMYKVESFIAAAEKHAASDIHLTVGEHPRMRIHGKLRTIGGQEAVLSDENINAIIQSTQPATMYKTPSGEWFCRLFL
jgi:Tfp pilus assembly pilus retraction ATPase PilT